MAVAAWRLLRIAAITQRSPAGNAVQSSAMHAWGWQLALGAAWPAIFFGFHAKLAALVTAAVLAVNIAVTIRKFVRLDTAAAILLTPVLFWSGFILYLTAGFWWLNP
jgi:benzodiazapine receptor